MTTTTHFTVTPEDVALILLTEENFNEILDGCAKTPEAKQTVKEYMGGHIKGGDNKIANALGDFSVAVQMEDWRYMAKPMKKDAAQALLKNEAILAGAKASAAALAKTLCKMAARRAK